MTNTEIQNIAAGGEGQRVLILGSGVRVNASIAVFKAKLGYQFYAYLRFKTGGVIFKRYVGNVTAETREESLRRGWSLVRKKQIVESSGWKWHHQEQTAISREEVKKPEASRRAQVRVVPPGK